MNTFGGLLILFSFLVFARTGYEFWTGMEDAWSTGAVGLFFLAVGYFLAVREPRQGVVTDITEVPEHLETEVERGFVEPVSDEAHTPARAIFSVVQTGDDAVLDKVRSLMAKDNRITSIVLESGRWYSVPDGDDLPEWFALRACCRPELIDQVMDDTEKLIREKLGAKAASEVSISRYA